MIQISTWKSTHIQIDIQRHISLCVYLWKLGRKAKQCTLVYYIWTVIWQSLLELKRIQDILSSTNIFWIIPLLSWGEFIFGVCVHVIFFLSYGSFRISWYWGAIISIHIAFWHSTPWMSWRLGHPELVLVFLSVTVASNSYELENRYPPKIFLLQLWGTREWSGEEGRWTSDEWGCFSFPVYALVFIHDAGWQQQWPIISHERKQCTVSLG